MVKILDKYKALSFKEKNLFSTILSVGINLLFAIGKFILAIYNGVFFFVSGMVNVFVMGAKLQCYLGIKYPEKRSFKYRNNIIGLFLLLAGFEYAVYMTRLAFNKVEPLNYDMFLAIAIAFISFVEMGFAIYGCFKSFGKGHYFRNIKLISFCSALTAIALTEVALMTFASETDMTVFNGYFGMGIGTIIEIIAIFIFIAPKFSIYDREYNLYKGYNIVEKKEQIEITLTNSKFYGNYIYKGTNINGIIDGHIVRGKNPFSKWNIYIKVLAILLSEILIFPYAVGAFFFNMKGKKIVDNLDKIMLEKGYKKVENLKGEEQC